MYKSFLILSLLVIVSCQSNDELFVFQKKPIDLGKIDRVLILGNSITYAPPSQQHGWFGNWGMAASSAQKDYSHLLKQEILKHNPACEFMISNSGVYIEREYQNLDTSKFEKEINFAPDLIIINIGENIEEETFEAQTFENTLSNLILALKPNSSTTVVLAGSFWSKGEVDQSIAKVCSTFDYGFVVLRDLSYSETNMALSDYENMNVAVHPNDTGMQKIADRILASILSTAKD